MKLAVQLEFSGNCREAFQFYEEVLDGEITVMNSMADQAEVPLPPGSNPGPLDAIRFAELHFGEDVLRGNDVPPGEEAPIRGVNLSLHFPKAAEARRVFEALSDGGVVTTPLAKVAWAAQFGMVTDRFGVPWLILGFEE